MTIIFILSLLPSFMILIFFYIFRGLSSKFPRRVSHQIGIGLFLLLMGVASFAIASNPLLSFIALPEAIILVIVGVIVIIGGILNKIRIDASWKEDDFADDIDDDSEIDINKDDDVEDEEYIQNLFKKHGLNED